jgi:hypothetical protein
MSKTQDGMRQTIDLLILDFSKAFDTVPRRRLLHKIQHYGVEGLTNKWIGSWLCQRKQKVVLDGYSSEKSSVISGVPQGRYWVLVILRRWHLAALNLISQVCDQSTSVLRSCCSCLWSCLVSMVLYSKQSSVYIYY